eukprot:TRINITY_DN5574_c0_g1_i5.p1 TRINITY_DN5574_c0_g1~~TRINITY_DN5574_c0_g1_i5.p1  ORF type:complete len:219 (-),score=60.58 TRINITY_DN5574_c0_g1_i5:145-801(-)
MIRRPPRSTHCISSAASDVYKRQYQRRVHGEGENATTEKQNDTSYKNKNNKNRNTKNNSKNNKSEEIKLQQKKQGNPKKLRVTNLRGIIDQSIQQLDQSSDSLLKNVDENWIQEHLDLNLEDKRQKRLKAAHKDQSPSHQQESSNRRQSFKEQFDKVLIYRKQNIFHKRKGEKSTSPNQLLTEENSMSCKCQHHPNKFFSTNNNNCLLYTSPSPRDQA